MRIKLSARAVVAMTELLGDGVWTLKTENSNDDDNNNNDAMKDNVS